MNIRTEGSVLSHCYAQSGSVHFKSECDLHGKSRVMFFKRKYIDIPDDNVLLETKYWIVNQRMDTEYPGYLMIGSKESAFRISELCNEALSSMGLIIGAVEKRIYECLKPKTVIVSKLGFSKGFSCHFHLIPVYSWVYNAIRYNESYSISEPDGSDFALFITRQYCDGNEQLPKKALNHEEAIGLLDLQSLKCELEHGNT